MSGSSPLTRGKPAWDATRHRALPAHPRSRGENVLPARGWASHPGSSPLTRGKPPYERLVHARTRLIPAHAGKTTRCTSLTRSPTAHPRSRGENLEEDSALVDFFGSSPLTRGKPARPGPHPVPSRAHPRSRGENGTRKHITYLKRGSSPLTRGKPPRPALPVTSARLIPAHAGKTGTHASS